MSLLLQQRLTRFPLALFSITLAASILLSGPVVSDAATIEWTWQAEAALRDLSDSEDLSALLDGRAWRTETAGQPELPLSAFSLAIPAGDRVSTIRLEDMVVDRLDLGEALAPFPGLTAEYGQMVILSAEPAASFPAEYLHAQGAILTGCDVADSVFEELQTKGIQIKRVGLDEIYDAPADVFAPNAIGGTLTDDTIARLKTAGVQIVCGAANNQQQDQTGGSQSRLMHKIDMLYCPDYIINAGGVIWVAKVGENAKTVTEDIRTGVPRRFKEILDRHEDTPDKDMASIAAHYSHQRVEAAQLQSKSQNTGAETQNVIGA